VSLGLNIILVVNIHHWRIYAANKCPFSSVRFWTSWKWSTNFGVQ